MIQEKISYSQYDEHYKVIGKKNNQVMENKCHKVISVTETHNDAEVGESQLKGEGRRTEEYKFVDMFLTKKFFGMFQDLTEFIERNLRCVVESVVVRFVINREREPFLAAIEDLEVRPARQMWEMKEIQAGRERGSMGLQEYLRCVQRCLEGGARRMEAVYCPRTQKCRGKMCGVFLQEVALPSLGICRAICSA
jgi:hypothetical protein